MWSLMKWSMTTSSAMIVNARTCYHLLLLPSCPPSLLPLCACPQHQVCIVVEPNTEIILAADHMFRDEGQRSRLGGAYHRPRHSSCLVKSRRTSECRVGSLAGPLTGDWSWCPLQGVAPNSRTGGGRRPSWSWATGWWQCPSQSWATGCRRCPSHSWQRDVGRTRQRESSP